MSILRLKLPIRKVSDKQRKRLAELEKVNALVWERDSGRCVRCGSTRIAGVPFKSGSHHLFGRNTRPNFFLRPDLMALLCIECHNNFSNTVMVTIELLNLLRNRYHYEYADPELQWYLKSV